MSRKLGSHNGQKAAPGKSMGNCAYGKTAGKEVPSSSPTKTKSSDSSVRASLFNNNYYANKPAMRMSSTESKPVAAGSQRRSASTGRLQRRVTESEFTSMKTRSRPGHEQPNPMIESRFDLTTVSKSLHTTQVKPSPGNKDVLRPRNARDPKDHSDAKEVGPGFATDKSPREASSGQELCKDCKSSALESVCYINNDGKIAASKTNANIRHYHYCSSPRCAANANYLATTPPSRKSLTTQRKWPVSQIAKGKSSVSRLADCHAVDSNTKPSIHSETRGPAGVQSVGDESGQNNSKGSGDIISSEQGLELNDGRQADCNNPVSDENCAKLNDQSYRIICRAEAEDQSPVSDENYAKLNDQRYRIICRPEAEDQQANTCSTPNIGQNKSVFYHADNELSCSEDSTDAMTPHSLSQCAFDVLSSTDLDDSPTQQKTKGLNVARMRRNYLNALKEQEAETVRLRKQEIQARKHAGDWMLDCAMEEVLHRLAPNGEARVKVLVEAFETVIHHSDSDSQPQLTDLNLAHNSLSPDRAVSMSC